MVKGLGLSVGSGVAGLGVRLGLPRASCKDQCRRAYS